MSPTWHVCQDYTSACIACYSYGSYRAGKNRLQFTPNEDNQSINLCGLHVCIDNLHSPLSQDLSGGIMPSMFFTGPFIKSGSSGLSWVEKSRIPSRVSSTM